MSKAETMKAYILVDVTITDELGYEEYKQLTPPSLIPFQGKFIVRGGNVTPLEGDWQTGRIVILEFPTKELAEGWYNSNEYNHAKKIRQASSVGKFILVEGL